MEPGSGIGPCAPSQGSTPPPPPLSASALRGRRRRAGRSPRAGGGGEADGGVPGSAKLGRATRWGAARPVVGGGGWPKGSFLFSSFFFLRLRGRGRTLPPPHPDSCS